MQAKFLKKSLVRFNMTRDKDEDLYFARPLLFAAYIKARSARLEAREVELWQVYMQAATVLERNSTRIEQLSKANWSSFWQTNWYSGVKFLVEFRIAICHGERMISQSKEWACERHLCDLQILSTELIKVQARYSFSGSTPPKFWV